MTSEAETKYWKVKGTFWKLTAIILAIACGILFISFTISVYLILTGPPRLSDVEKAYLDSMRSQGQKPIVLHGLLMYYFFCFVSPYKS